MLYLLCLIKKNKGHFQLTATICPVRVVFLFIQSYSRPRESWRLRPDHSLIRTVVNTAKNSWKKQVRAQWKEWEKNGPLKQPRGGDDDSLKLSLRTHWLSTIFSTSAHISTQNASRNFNSEMKKSNWQELASSLQFGRVSSPVEITLQCVSQALDGPTARTLFQCKVGMEEA